MFQTYSYPFNLISINNRMPPFCAKFKTILMNKWYLIERQPLLKEIFKEPPIISYRKGKPFKDILVRA